MHRFEILGVRRNDDVVLLYFKYVHLYNIRLYRFNHGTYLILVGN